MRHLVIKAQQKDQNAFVALMELNKQSMYKVAKAYLHGEEDVADVMQETILTCYEKLDTLRKPEYFKTWMIRILINKCKDQLGRMRETVWPEGLPEEGREDSAQENIEFMELLNELDEKYRTILVLYYVEGFCTREIAQILEMNEHTVKTRLARARKQFAGVYQGATAGNGRVIG